MSTHSGTSLAAEPVLGAPLGSSEALPPCSKTPSVPCSENTSSTALGSGSVPPGVPMKGALSAMSQQEATNALGAQSVAVPAIALMLLAAVAVVLSRRRRDQGRLVRILESTSLGPKRSLVVAQMGKETLLIGSSESGLCLLAARPSIQEHNDVETKIGLPKYHSVEPDAVESPSGEPAVSLPNAYAERRQWGAGADSLTSPSCGGPKLQPKAETPNEAAENLARLLSFGDAKEQAHSAQFQSLLAESVEDQELRRKFAAGAAGKKR